MTLHLGREVAHHTWDRDEPPAIEVIPGKEIELCLRDGSNAQLGRTSSAQEILHLDPKQMDPLTGPVLVDGARPGDVLTVDIVEVRPAHWGWSGIIPGLGLLEDYFPGPLFRVWDLQSKFIEIDGGHRFDLSPMIGVMGVAPPQSGQYPSVVPTDAGGNMDVKYMSPGARAYFPVFVDGALLSLGDPHAIQGDGELSGTAIECEADVLVRVGLERGGGISAPMIDTVARTALEEPMRSFMGIGPDLFEASKEAALRATEALAKALHCGPEDAYALLGTLAELRIHEIVDKPNWVVGCMLPTRLLR